jgi:hypothetical protein
MQHVYQPKYTSKYGIRPTVGQYSYFTLTKFWGDIRTGFGQSWTQ